jgi:signal transduction histidine kinase
MVPMETRDWIRDGWRALAWGALSIALALTNIPLIVLFVVSLALTPVLGAGLILFPLVVRLVRRRTDLSRRLAARWGVTIDRPYKPEPPGMLPVGWSRWRFLVTDSATWQDLAWLLPGFVVGVVLGVLTLVLPVYGLEGILLIPLVIWLTTTGTYGYGAVWPIHSVSEGFLSLPQGALILGLGLALAPYLRRWDAHFARLLLAPTPAARLRLRVAQLTVTRADTVDAQAAELRRIERDLHDGAQARLVSLGMAIGLAEEIVERDPAGARKLLAEARESSTTALVELRHLVRGIHPPVLAERGLDGAVRALALHLPVPVNIDSDVTGRLPTPVESAAYFAVAEALANLTRHSGARFGFVVLRLDDERLQMQVGDDGHGGADPVRGTGLRGIERRLAAFDGTMTLSSPAGGPTIVTMELPCVSSSPKIMLSSETA